MSFRFFFEPGLSAAIKLPLRRRRPRGGLCAPHRGTLVRLVIMRLKRSGLTHVKIKSPKSFHQENNTLCVDSCKNCLN